MSSPLAPSDSIYERLLAADADHPRPLRVARASASVVLWRQQPTGLEVFWVRRSPRLRFMGGWWAFPGGGLEPSDAELAIHGRPSGIDADACHRHPSEGGPGDPIPAAVDLIPGLLACALRELFEETGLLMGMRSDPDAALRARRQLLAGEVTFADLVRDLEAQPDARPLTFAGRWLTPAIAPMRFDNRFFLLPWPATRALQPQVLPGELVAGAWIRPADALARWGRGEVLAAPPILHILAVLADAGPERGLPRLHDTREADLGPLRRIELLPGVLLLPLATVTLPPATHTNAYLLGRRDAVLIDPAPGPGDEQDRLLAALDAAQREHGLRLRAVWLTHHHRDHVGAATRVRAAFGVPIAAHAASRPGLGAQGIEIDQTLEEGDRLVLEGTPRLTLEVLHTPGHTQGHLAVMVEPWQALVAGDLVSALSTMVIDPPEGDMDAYLGSLEAARAHAPRILLPGHGPLITAAGERLRWFHRHRLARETQVREAWQAAANDHQRTAAILADTVYGSLDPLLRTVAARQVEAHLVRLRRQGAL